MTSGHLEVEAKYDVDDGFGAPELSGLPGVAAVEGPVEHLLEAVYLDTDDLRLLRARITLRRRTGGADAGWHLKLPAGAARRELHAPLGRATKNPPRALQESVVGILRGASVRPVATLRTRRLVTTLRGADGQVLAEIADDVVSATVPSVPDGAAEMHAWREVEVELGAGDEALATAVGERLLVAGAQPSATASKVGRVLAGRLAGLPAWTAPRRKKKGPRAAGFLHAALTDQVASLQEADVLLRTEQPDAVHQVRVAARRLRSTLAAFHPLIEEPVHRSLRDELSWLGGQLAGARDDEVGLEHLRAVIAAQPEELVLGPVAARLQQTELREVRAGLDRALRTLSEPRYLQLLDALHAFLADPPFTAEADAALKPALRATTRRSVARLRRRLATARQAPDAERAVALHDVRKAAKRARYAAEVGKGGVAHVKAVARSAKQVQQVLGEVQDTIVTRELCRRLGMQAAAAGENAFTYGRLHGLEQARSARAEADFWAMEREVRSVLKAAE